jgi:hypothetical protein
MVSKEVYATKQIESTRSRAERHRIYIGRIAYPEKRITDNRAEKCRDAGRVRHAISADPTASSAPSLCP